MYTAEFKCPCGAIFNTAEELQKHAKEMHGRRY